MKQVSYFVVYYFSIDATYTDCLGRYINDRCASKANAEVKRLYFDGKAHLVFFAKKDIQKGEEVRYDYGSPNLDWRVSTLLSTYFAPLIS